MAEESKQQTLSLIDACEKGNFEIVRRLVTEEGVNVGKKNEYGETALSKACEEGHLDIVPLLVKEGGAAVNQADEFGITALHLACEEGHFAIVKWLVSEGGADVNQPDEDGDTSLFFACKRGNYDLVPVLLGAGAQISRPEHKMWQRPEVQKSLALAYRTLSVAPRIESALPGQGGGSPVQPDWGWDKVQEFIGVCPTMSPLEKNKGNDDFKDEEKDEARIRAFESQNPGSNKCRINTCDKLRDDSNKLYCFECWLHLQVMEIRAMFLKS